MAPGQRVGTRHGDSVVGHQADGGVASNCDRVGRPRVSEEPTVQASEGATARRRLYFDKISFTNINKVLSK